jgi:hypothetical protein
VLESRSTNTAHQPVIEALKLITRVREGREPDLLPLGEVVPEHHGTAGEWAGLVHRTDKQGRRRVVRMVYEVATFQALRDQLRCKEIWVAGAVRWRDPDEDLPKDFEDRRPAAYASLRKLRQLAQAAGPGRLHRRPARGDDHGAGRAGPGAAGPALGRDRRAGLATAELAQRIDTGGISGCKAPEVPLHP